MIMTAEGPVSMCEHNTRRDEYILKPIALPGRPYAFDPRTGALAPRPSAR